MFTMNRRQAIIRAALFIALLFIHAPPSSMGESQEDAGLEGLEKRIRAVVKGMDLKDAAAGIHVMEVDSGKTVYAFNEKKPLNPASGIKVLTALAALHYLGPEHRFGTSLYGEGMGKGTIKRLFLKGEGDPSLETAHLREMADALEARGVREIDGDIVIDASYFDDVKLPYGYDHHPKADEQSVFRAPVGAVSVNANAIRIRVAPGPSSGSAALVSVFPKGYADLENKAVTSKSGKHEIKISTWAAGDVMKVKVWGSVSAGYRGGVFERRAEDPLLLAGHGLRQVLEEKGIAVKGAVRAGKVPPKAGLLFRHSSEPLAAVLLNVGKLSQNFFAEQILKVVGAEVKGAPGTSQKGAEAALELLGKAGIDASGVTYRNGSGLYDANALPASAVTALLAYGFRSPEYGPEFLSQLALAGVDGTMKKRLGSSESLRHVRAKTGTLKGVTSLSGIVMAPAGKSPVAFSVIVNNAAGRIGYFRSIQDAVALEIAKYLYTEESP
jgi:D-alanyl-D-alanine carboxypeptidase/D-alanyl-D-alanine-endopeptidase (penicillin-binding protein 4)